MKGHIILNAQILTEDGLIDGHGIVIEGDRIAKLLPEGEIEIDRANYVIHDGRGANIIPGFIDIHADNIEWYIQPRPSSVMDIDFALMEQEKQLINQGITMMYHSICYLPEERNSEGKREARKKESMVKLAKLIKNMHEREHLIRHRFHLRYELTNINGYDTVIDFINRGYVDLLSFNDHTPGQGQYRNLIKYKEILRGYHPRSSSDELDEIIRGEMAGAALDNERTLALSKLCKTKGIAIASHDDDTKEKLNYVREVLKADISEFPISLEAARFAKEKGMLTVAGAPNVLMGGSHSGNLSALEGILDGSIDILCSDYYPASLLKAVYKLHKDLKMEFGKAVDFVSLNPAKALGIDGDYGSIRVGKKADLLMVFDINDRPVVKKVFIDGHLVSELNYRFNR